MSGEPTPHEYRGIGIVPRETALELGQGQTVARFLGAEARRADSVEPLLDMPQALIIVAGHEGSGKSRVTRTLEEASPVVVIDKDPLSNAFSNGRAEHGDPVHKAMRPTVYDTLYTIAGQVLDTGRSVILDAPFNKFEDFFNNPEWVTLIRETALARGASVKVVWCTASPEVKFKRMRARAAPQDERRTDDELRALASRADMPPPMEGFDMLVVDTELPDEVRAASLSDFLELSPVGQGADSCLTEIQEESTIAKATVD